MTTRLIIARHGNNFTKEQTPRRLGGRTDLPLVESERGTLIGRYLKDVGLIPVKVYAAPLKRTMQTAQLAIDAIGTRIPLEMDESFREIDYGPDENKTEDEVKERLGRNKLTKEGVDITKLTLEQIMNTGAEVIENWDKNGIVPEGWKVSIPEIINGWNTFADKVIGKHHNENVMVVSSNGIIRFAPYLTGDFEAFSKEFDIKVGTGCICIFEKEDGDKHWKCKAWNIKPKDYFKAKEQA